MEEQGLTTRASPTRSERPVSNSRLAGILRDPYYTGITRYEGKLYVGRHEALISKETFLKVQEILDQRNREGDRDIVHFHYLKGVLYCGECLQAGRRSRLLYSQNTGNGGMYEYFICTAKQRRLCSTPAIRVEQVEAHIVRAMAAERFSANPASYAEALPTRYAVICWPRSSTDSSCTSRTTASAWRARSTPRSARFTPRQAPPRRGVRQ
jgi:site-specific DNA recombinase